MAFAIRPADHYDAKLAARLMYLSMGELADYLFGGVHLSVDEILAGLFLLEGNRFSRNISDRDEYYLANMAVFPDFQGLGICSGFSPGT